MKLLLIGGDVARNLGDRSIRAAIVQQIRAVDPRADIRAYSKSPASNEDDLEITRHASSLVRLLGNVRALRELDAILWGGGLLLQDDSSKVKCVYWAFVLGALRRLSGRPIIGFGVGIGPLNTPWGRFFARRALRGIAHLILRDHASAECVASLGGRTPPVTVAPDPVVLLAPADTAGARRHLVETEGVPEREDELRVGIALRRWFHIRNNWFPHRWHVLLGRRRWRGAARFEQLKVNLASALNRVADEMPIRCLFFPMYSAPWEDDAHESEDLARRLKAPAHVLTLGCAPERLVALAGECDVFIGVRLHGALLAMNAGVPAIGVSYADKFRAAFAGLGMEDKLLAVNDVAGESGAERLYRTLAETIRNRAALARQIRERRSRLAAGCQVYTDMLERVQRRELG